MSNEATENNNSMRGRIFATFEPSSGEDSRLEPIIKVRTDGGSDDPADRALKYLFQTFSNVLSIENVSQIETSNEEGLPELIKNIRLKKFDLKEGDVVLGGDGTRFELVEIKNNIGQYSDDPEFFTSTKQADYLQALRAIALVLNNVEEEEYYIRAETTSNHTYTVNLYRNGVPFIGASNTIGSHQTLDQAKRETQKNTFYRIVHWIKQGCPSGHDEKRPDWNKGDELIDWFYRIHDLATTYNDNAQDRVIQVNDIRRENRYGILISKHGRDYFVRHIDVTDENFEQQKRLLAYQMFQKLCVASFNVAGIV